MQKSDSFAQSYACLITRFRWVIILASLLVTFWIGTGMQEIKPRNDYRLFFSDANPELANFEAFQDDYSKTDSLMFVIRNESGPILTPEVADSIEELTAKSWELPFATRVDSITNYQHTYGEADDLIVEDLIEDAALMSQEEILEKQAIALQDPLVNGNLISANADTVAVNITINLPSDDPEATPNLMNAARDLAAEFTQKHPNLHVAISGIMALNNAFGEASRKDMSLLIPIMYVFLIFMTFIVIRSFSGSVSTLAIIALSSICAMGMAGFTGIPLSPVSAAAPIIIMTLAIADSIHILVTMLGLYRSGMEKVKAIEESIRLNLVPVTMTSLTTIIGFLTLNFSDAPPYWHLGNLTAMGIVFAWAFSLTLLPALLAVSPMKKPKAEKSDWTKVQMRKLGTWVMHNQKPVLIVGGLITVILTIAAPTTQLNDEFVKYFSPNIQFRQDADYTAEHLSGIYLVDYSISSGQAEGISNPEYLNHLESLTQYLKQQPEVKHVYSYTDIIKRLNYNMHADDPQWKTIPDSQELAAQYLMLYEFSLPYGMELTNRINFDKSSSRLTLIVDNISSIQMREMIQRIDAWMANNIPETMRAKPTGTAVMFTYISERNVASMMKGNTLAIIIISLLMLMMLRSFKLGFISLLANALPIVMMFGVWALLVGQVGMVASTVAAGTLGIVVDDTVHFLSKYTRAIREMNMNRVDAIFYTLETVGVAMVSTTIILVVGFSILILSDFQLNMQTGLMSAITIILALLFDLLLLPAVLMGKQGEHSEQKSL